MLLKWALYPDKTNEILQNGKRTLLLTFRANELASASRRQLVGFHYKNKNVTFISTVIDHYFGKYAIVIAGKQSLETDGSLHIQAVSANVWGFPVTRIYKPVSWLRRLDAGVSPLTSFRLRSLSDLWWTKRHWYMFSSEYFDSALSASFHLCSVLIHLSPTLYILSNCQCN
jgi:hypothetical protein